MILPNLSKFILKKAGWTCINPLSNDVKQCVVILAPHTSNYDFIFGMLYKSAYKLKIRYLIKQEWVKGPLAPFFNWTGAIKINRAQPGNLVKTLTELLTNNEALILGITPEGTRKRVEKWKTGFYRIAKECNLPIYCGFMDYKKKEMGFAGHIKPTGDQEKDLKKIQEIYKNITAKNPENFNPVIS